MGLFRRGIHFGTYGEVDDGRELFKRACRAVEAAEACGFDLLGVPDHMLQNDVGGGPQSPMFEAYTLLGALAARTTSAKLLALVSPVTFRNPAFLAKSVATLDVLSDGRAVLGMGAGWDAGEHEAYGFAFPGVAERMDRLDEALTICRALFREPQASFSGAYYTVDQAWNSPKPISGDIPILIGGGGERRTLNLVARHADACNVFGDAAGVRHKFDVLERHCHEVGRDPSEITRTVFVMAGEDLAQFREELASLSDVGVQGVIVMGSFDVSTIEALGKAVVQEFP